MTILACPGQGQSPRSGGTFVPTADGYAGHIRTLSVRCRVQIPVNERPHGDHVPEFKLLCGEAAIGAA